MRIYLTDEEVRQHILESMRILNIERMPTASEFKVIDKEYLHNKISRGKKYSGWASELGIPMKLSTTTQGSIYEQVIADKLTGAGFNVERMTTKHPYDLLINKAVKIDVKSANIYRTRDNSEVHTFNLAKKNPTCDIYVLIALNSDGEIAKELIVPSHFVNQKVIAIGVESIYDKFHGRYDYVKQYADFYEGVAI